MLNSQNAAMFLASVILGILFFFQGYDKVFKIKMNGVISTFRYELGEIRLPGWLLTLSAFYTSYVEMICGFLLIIGLFKTWALYLLGIDLILVTGAFSMIRPLWDVQFVFARLILLVALLLMPAEWDVISLDHLLR